MTTGLSGSYDPRDDEYPDLPEVSDRSRSVAVVLGLLGGVFGLHRFYAGRVQSGVYMVLTFGGLGVWWLYDMVMLVSGEFRDADARPIRNWEVAAAGPTPGGGSREARQLREDLDLAQRQIAELAERMDFAERMLTQHRERHRLGP
jgi:hypothetical protein